MDWRAERFCADAVCRLQEHQNGNGHHSSASHKETGYILNELIVALMRNSTLTEEEGKTMLKGLLHRDFLP